MSNSEIFNHERVISGTVCQVLLQNVKTDQTTMMSTRISLNKLNVLGGTGNALIFLYNRTDDDYTSITNSWFDSPNVEYILYMTSCMDLSKGSDLGGATRVVWNNNLVVNCSKSSLIWTSSDSNETDWFMVM